MKYMVFLNWIDDVLERAFDIIGGFFNVIWSFLCSIIYGLITLMFNIFTKLTQMDILDEGNININGIYQRMTMIITIIMIFYITFEFIKYVLQPDTINDKEKGAEGIIKRIVIAILLIAFIPTVFTTAMKLQDKILETNVIPKVIFGQKDFDYKNAGSNFSGDVFAAFYRVNYENCQPNCQNAEKKVDSVIKSWKERQGLAALAKANAYEIIDIDNSIQFDGLLAVIFGCFALYVIFLYCIDMGVRFVQLLFLQIIAPVAAISYIIPQKDSMLNKWIKQVATTYLDVFIRYAVLYFMLLIMSILSSSLDFYELSRDGKQITIWLYIFIVMGLLIFVQRAPKLIEELLPKSSGAASIGFDFSGKSRFEPLGKTISSFLKPAAAIQGVASGVSSVFKKDPNGKIKIGKNRYGFNTDLVKDIKGNKFWDKVRKGATYGTSAAKAGYQGAKAGAKTGRFDQAKLAAQQSTQKDESVVSIGGSVLGATFKGTSYQNLLAKMNLTIKEKEELAKKIEAQINVEKTAKTSQDALEDRAKSKIKSHEQKITVRNAEDIKALTAKLPDLEKLGIKISEEQTTSQIYSMFEAATNSRKASADAVNQELTKLETARALATTDKEKSEISKNIDQLKTLADQKTREAIEAEAAQEKALKELGRFAITRTMKVATGQESFKDNEEDKVLTSNATTALSAIKNIRASIQAAPDAELADKLRAILGETNFAKFMNPEISDYNLSGFTELDGIQGILTGHASTLSNQSNEIKEEIRRVKESEEYSRNAANASEGKK